MVFDKTYRDLQHEPFDRRRVIRIIWSVAISIGGFFESVYTRANEYDKIG